MSCVEGHIKKNLAPMALYVGTIVGFAKYASYFLQINFYG